MRKDQGRRANHTAYYYPTNQDNLHVGAVVLGDVVATTASTGSRSRSHSRSRGRIGWTAGQASRTSLGIKGELLLQHPVFFHQLLLPDFHNRNDVLNVRGAELVVCWWGVGLAKEGRNA